jgi:peptide/nickel transport system permease protein
MIRLILRRLVAVIPTLLIVTFGTFLLVKLAPSDPASTAAGGIEASPADIARVREELHLNDPLLSQYWRWLSHAAQGDLGNSYISKRSVADDLHDKVRVTIGLIFAATVFALIVAVPLGILSGLRPNGTADRIGRVYSAGAVSIPSYVIATALLVQYVAVEWKWLPPLGYTQFGEDPLQWLRYITLPAISLGVAISAAITRQLRAALVDELDTNHIRTGWAIGGAPRRVVGRHGLKNASLPAITIIGLQITALVGGTVIIEQIFSIPGIGLYLLGAINSGDIPAVQGCVLVLAIIAIAMSLLVDILYALLNPKVRVAA